MDFKTEYQYGKMLYKRFTKINRKREKKGQTPLTQDEFAKIIRKENQIYSKKTLLVIEAIGTIALVLIFPIRNIIYYGIDWFDIVFGFIAVPTVLVTLHYSNRSSQMMAAAYHEILDRCEVQGIDIVTYWEAL